MIVEELIGSLFSHESRIIMEEESLEHAFKTQEIIGRGREKVNHHAKGRTTPE
jgi:hypothetical protein